MSVLFDAPCSLPLPEKYYTHVQNDRVLASMRCESGCDDACSRAERHAHERFRMPAIQRCVRPFATNSVAIGRAQPVGVAQDSAPRLCRSTVFAHCTETP